MAKRSGERDAARAEYVARRERGEEVNLRQFAEERGIKYDTLRRWKSADQVGGEDHKEARGATGKQKRQGQPRRWCPGGKLKCRERGRLLRNLL